MRSRRSIAAGALVSALALPATGAAQDALVLSGGGARGLAHVGVLLRLEELGYDPDIVVGNSMGAVIGALYAAGYSADEIRARVEAVDWSAMFSAMPMISGPLQEVRTPMFSFDLNIRDLRVNRGLLGEWRINRALASLLFDANVRAAGDFDRLPRRYRALAADLESGRAVVLERGDLARAVRASMAYPGFFAPVMHEGRLLVDGGIVDNLPTLEARALGGERIVAVDVSRPARPIASLAPLAIAQRALNLMQMNLHRDTVPPDELVQLDIDSNFTGAYFPDDPIPLMEAGHAAAVRDLDGFSAASDPRPRSTPAPPDSLRRLIVAAPDTALHALVSSALTDIVPGPYDPDAILEALDRLYATGLFQALWPTVEYEGPARTAALRIRAEAASYRTVSVATGYDNDRGGRIWASFDRYTRYGRNPGLHTIAGSFTPLHRWASVSTQVLSRSRPGLALTVGAHVRERSVRTFRDDVRESIETWRAGGWLGLELPLNLRSAFLTAALRAERIDPENGDSDHVFGPHIRLSGVAPELPLVGEPILLEGGIRWGTRSYATFAARASLPFDVADLKLAVVGDLRSTSRNTPGAELPALGDQHAVPGLRWGEVRGRHRGVFGIDGARRVGAGHVRMRLRTGAVTDTLDELDRTEWVSGGQIGLVWPIPLGVIQVGWGIATRGDGRFIVDIGRPF